MGLRDWAAKAPTATFGNYLLRRDSIEKVGGKDRGKHPLQGVTAVVESGEALQSRVTATRILAIGVFALAAKKKSGGESYLTIEGPGFAWVEEVDRKKRADAVAFAAKVRAAASSAPPE